MSKVDKKKAKLEERIEYLQEQMKSNLGKKTHDTAEINLPKTLSEIAELRNMLRNIK